MSAGSFKLDNLIGIVDVNNMQADGPSTGVLNFEPLAPKFEAFGWYVQRVDGNDIDALVAAFEAARDLVRAASPGSSSATPRWPRAWASSRSASATISCASSRRNGRRPHAFWTPGGRHEPR